MSSYRSRRDLTALGLALLLAAGCQGMPGRVGAPEDNVTIERGTGKVRIAGKSIGFRTADGRPVGGLAIQVGGKTYPLNAGRLVLPEAVLAEATKRGGFVLLAPGYVPRHVKLEDGGEVALTPLGPTLARGAGGASGAELAAPGGGVRTYFAPGLLLGDGVALSLSEYAVTPQNPDRTGFADERAALLAARGRPAADDCERPLPCPPFVSSLGLLVTVDGPVGAGELRVVYDLRTLLDGWDGQGPGPWERDAAAWPADRRRRAEAAARILRTFSQIDATADLEWRRQLERQFGITLQNSQLAFPVRFGERPAGDGFARIEVAGSSLLGVRLEVTLVAAEAAAGGTLPPGGAPPAGTGLSGSLALPAPVRPPARGLALAGLIGADGSTLIVHDGAGLLGTRLGQLIGADGSTLIGADGSTLIGADGSTLIGADGSTLIGADGSTLIGNDGASLISLNAGGALVGRVLTPQEVVAAKYALLDYTELPEGGATVRALTGLGTPLGAPVTAGADGRFRLAALPVTLNGVMLEATVAGKTLRTLAPAPGKRETAADLTAASSGMAAIVMEAVQATPGNTLPVGLSAFGADVATLHGLMTQADADFMVSNPLPAVAARARAILAAAGKAPQTPGAPPFVAQGPQPASALTGTAIAIAGANFSGPAGDWSVAFNGLPGAVTAVAPGSLTVQVPAAATDGPVTVTRVAGAGSGQTVTAGSFDAVRLLGATPTAPDPWWLAFDQAGDAWVSHKSGNTLTRLDPSGAVRATYPTAERSDYLSVDQAGTLWVVEVAASGGSTVGRYDVGGAGAPVLLGQTGGLNWVRWLAPDGAGNAWVTYGVSPASIARISAAGVLGAGIQATGFASFGIAVDGAGDLWLAGSKDRVVKRFSSSGVLEGTFATPGEAMGLEVDAAGNVWTGNWSPDVLTKFSSTGQKLGEYPMSGKPGMFTFDAAGNVWVPLGEAGNLVKVSPDGRTLGTFPIGGEPVRAAFDAQGDLWVTSKTAGTVVRLRP